MASESQSRTSARALGGARPGDGAVRSSLRRTAKLRVSFRHTVCRLKFLGYHRDNRNSTYTCNINRIKWDVKIIQKMREK